MKKIATSGVLALLMLCMFLLPSAASSARLDDGADLLTSEEELWLELSLDTVSEQYGIDLIVVTRDDLDGYSSESYANRYYDSRSYDYDAMLLLIGPGEGYNYILTNGECTDALNDDRFDEMIEDILWELGFDDYYNACNVFVTQASDAMAYYEEYGIDDGGWSVLQCALAALVIGLVIGFITVSVMRSKLKSVKMQAAANDYVRQNSLVLTRRDELFLYSTTTRVAKPKNNSSSSGGRGGGSRGGRSF